MTSNTSSTPESVVGSRSRLDQSIADAMRLVWQCLLALAAPDRLHMISRCRLMLDTIESQTIAEQIEAGLSSRKVEDMLASSNNGSISKRTVKQKARRGAAVRENPDIGAKMAAGELSSEQLDVIADASEKTGGDAAHDPELIAKIAAAPPEQGKKLADAYVRDRQTQEEVDNIHTKARRARRVGRYTNHERGTEVLLLEGSATDIDQIEMEIDTLADKFYRQDGGRDVNSNDHRRTRDQRRFDAAMSLFGKSHERPTEADGNARVSKVTKKASHTTAIVIQATLAQAQGVDISPLVLADGKPLPSAVAERLACGADFMGQIFGADGEILWQGRSVRNATFGQRLALIARDGGCVRCDAGHSRCVAHHLDPWTSRLRGKTDVERMALVCDDCHHHIHDNKLTLYRDDGGIWRTRRAKPEEIAAEGPPRARSRPTRDESARPRPVSHPNEERPFTRRE